MSSFLQSESRGAWHRSSVASPITDKEQNVDRQTTSGFGAQVFFTRHISKIDIFQKVTEALSVGGRSGPALPH